MARVIRNEEPQPNGTRQLGAYGVKVVIEADELEKVTPGGIALPDTTNKKPSIGTVRAVGRGEVSATGLVSLDVSVGDRVAFDPYAAMVTEVENKKYHVVNYRELLIRL